MFGIVTNAQLLKAINDLKGLIMSTQDEINIAAQQIETDVTAMNAALTAIQAEIAQLQAQNPSLDLTALNQAVTDLGTAVSAEQAAVPPAG